MGRSSRSPGAAPSLGEAIRYTVGQWDALTRFTGDARLALDNNASERALRAIALGRKNYLFVGNDEAGENLAGLMSLLAICEANGVNPEAYLADVLLRLSSHPASKPDDLLPHRWQQAPLPPADSPELPRAFARPLFMRGAAAHTTALRSKASGCDC